MKKRILLTALLVIPMGATFAWYQGVNRPQAEKTTASGPQSEVRLGTITTGNGSNEAEARLGTLSGRITTGGGSDEAAARLGTAAHK